MTVEADLDRVIPESAVLSAAIALLDEAAWRFDCDEGRTESIPRHPAPCVATRAFIKAHAPDIFLGDHYEAVVYLAPTQMGENLVPQSGALKLYFTRTGELVSNDYIPSS